MGGKFWTQWFATCLCLFAWISLSDQKNSYSQPTGNISPPVQHLALSSHPAEWEDLFQNISRDLTIYPSLNVFTLQRYISDISEPFSSDLQRYMASLFYSDRNQMAATAFNEILKKGFKRSTPPKMKLYCEPERDLITDLGNSDQAVDPLLFRVGKVGEVLNETDAFIYTRLYTNGNESAMDCGAQSYVDAEVFLYSGLKEGDLLNHYSQLNTDLLYQFAQPAVKLGSGTSCYPALKPRSDSNMGIKVTQSQMRPRIALLSPYEHPFLQKVNYRNPIYSGPNGERADVIQPILAIPLLQHGIGGSDPNVPNQGTFMLDWTYYPEDGIHFKPQIIGPDTNENMIAWAKKIDLSKSDEAPGNWEIRYCYTDRKDLENQSLSGYCFDSRVDPNNSNLFPYRYISIPIPQNQSFDPNGGIKINAYMQIAFWTAADGSMQATRVRDVLQGDEYHIEALPIATGVLPGSMTHTLFDHLTILNYVMTSSSGDEIKSLNSSVGRIDLRVMYHHQDGNYFKFTYDDPLENSFNFKNFGTPLYDVNDFVSASSQDVRIHSPARGRPDDQSQPDLLFVFKQEGSQHDLVAIDIGALTVPNRTPLGPMFTYDVSKNHHIHEITRSVGPTPLEDGRFISSVGNNVVFERQQLVQIALNRWVKKRFVRTTQCYRKMSHN